ncbi:MAG: hypothetical protein WCC60_18940 [Ilumatobacteraceae bacterium]
MESAGESAQAARSSFGRWWTGVIIVAFGLLVAAVVASAVSGNWTLYLAALAVYTTVFLASVVALAKRERVALGQTFVSIVGSRSFVAYLRRFR